MKIEEKKLPKDWKIKKLGEVCDIIMGQSPPSSSYNYNKIGLPFFQGKAEFTELYPVVEKWCDSPNKIALPNDILLSVRAPVGTTNIANQKCCIGRGLAAIRYDNYKYVFYFLRRIEQQLDKKGTGTTFRAISGKTIKSTEIPIPPLPEQQQIVAKIEELFSELENGKKELLIAQAKLKTYRQSLLKWAFEGRLTNKNLKDGELPKGWEVKRLVEVCTYSKGKMPKVLTEEKSGKCLTPYINIKAFERGIFSEYTDGEKCNLCNDDDLLMVWDGARCGLIGKAKKGAVGSTLMKILPKEIIHKEFLYYFISSKFRTLNTKPRGVGIPHVEPSLLWNFEILLPPLAEQQTIVAILESKLTICDAIEETIKTSINKSEALRQSILKKAFEGQLIVPKIQKSLESNYKNKESKK